MAGRSGLEDLELTGEEVERLRRAFQDEEFRRLFAEYAAELADPAQRAVYEAEVVALERQRGVEARFLHPTPGWVLRTSQAGARRCYLNVCGSALVGRPEARREAGGSRWELPHCLAPGREELGRRPGAPRRLVYDVLFHPDALGLAARSARFRRLVDETALEAVERHFSPGLDRANAVPLRGVKYKGLPQAALLRTPLSGGAPPAPEGEERDSPLPPFPSPYAYPPPPPAPQRLQPEPAPAASAATTPRWTLRQRSYVDLQDYRCSRDSAPSPVPRELEVTVELPLLGSAAQAQLEVRGRELRLDSRRPAAYRLRLPLPYPVDEEGGRATFDKSLRRLVVTLPVLRPEPPVLPGLDEEAPPEPSASRDSPSSPEPPEGSRTAPADDLPQPASEPPSPAVHVGTNHVQLPVCAEESSPGSAGAGGRPGESDDVCPALLDARLGPTPELPGSFETGDPVASDAASFSVEESARERSPESGAPEGCSSARDNECHEPDCVPLAPQLSVGNSVELPACPTVTGPAVTHVAPGNDMDLRPCPEVTDAVPSSELGGATIPSAHLCGVSSDRPMTPECHNLSNADQNMATSASPDGAWYPGSCRNPVAPASPNTTPSVDLSLTSVSAANSPPYSTLLSRPGLGVDPEAALSPSSSPDTPLSPNSQTPPLCPPFQCTQDDEALILLLQVPGIISHSLKGEVDTHQYRVSFASEDLVSYTLFLQLPAENKLTCPETSISVSSDNAVIHLTKAPETTGLWTKLYFGLTEDAMQNNRRRAYVEITCNKEANSLHEKLFVTEDNVVRFLDSCQRPSCPCEPDMEGQPLIEVLDVSESQSRIRLKLGVSTGSSSLSLDDIMRLGNAQEHDGPEAGKAQEQGDPGAEDSKPPFGAESCPLAPDSAAEHTTQTSAEASDSLTAAETEEPAGWGPRHCLGPDPADSGFSAPGKLQRTKLQESELAFATDSGATATEQTQPDGGEPAGTRDAAGSDSAESGSPAAPVLRETDLRDGSVQLISHHTTHCPITFQNPLLYELD